MKGEEAMDQLSNYVSERSRMLQDEIENLQIEPESDEWIFIVEINGAQISLLDELYVYIKELKSKL